MKSLTMTSVAATALIFSCELSHADSVPTAMSTAATTEPELEEVIVTAQKRSENVMTVPISITAISAIQLNESAAKNLEELEGVIPGITFPAATAYGGSSIVIRGTSGSATFLEDDPVAVYVDGIYQPSNSRFGVSDLSDVASVEVVRGPQGTLQGRNATAGAILVRTADPSASVDGFIRASVADPSETREEGAISLPISDTLGVRLSADHFNQTGWATNLYNDAHLGGEEATDGRAVILWKPIDQFSARLMINFQTLTNAQASQRWASTSVNPTGVAENLADPTPFVPLPAALQRFYLNGNQVYNDVPSRNTQRSPSAALELHYDFGPVEMVSLTGASHASNTGMTDSGGLGPVGTNGVSLIDAVTGEHRRAYNQGDITGSQVTEELRLQSQPGSPFKWLAGAFASHAVDDMAFDIFDYNLANSPPGDADVGFRAHQVDTSLAAFADATYSLTSRLSITGGIRYTNEQKRFNNAFSVTVPEIDLVVVGPFPYAPPVGRWGDTSYRGNVTYQLTPDTMAYLSYSKGFKSGGYNAFGAGPTPSYKPEDLYSTELGAKSFFWDKRASLTASVYTNSYKNLQVTAGVPTGGVNIYNAAQAAITGFEVEGHIRLSEQLSFTGNAAYTHAYYTSFQNGQGVDGNLVNATGNTLPNSPLWQFYVQGDYSRSLGAGWVLHTQISYRWRDTVYFFGTNEGPLYTNLQGASDGELGSRLEATYTPAQLTISIFGRNLTNTRVVNGEQADFAYPVAFFNEPRVVGVQLMKSF